SVVFLNTTNPLAGSNYTWNFGDGTTASNINPSKAYAIPGIYSVKLVALNPFGCSDSIIKTVTYPTTPNTQFSFTNSCTGQAVSFNNTSTIGIGSLSYNWDFGDGTSNSTIAQPSHTYINAGTYTVQLIATSQSGCKDTLSQLITIGLKPIANFSSPTIGVCSGTFVSFTNSTLNANGGTPYFWDFGDGTNSNLQNPNKQYLSPGTYTVILTAGFGTLCSDVITKSITIKESPVAAFTSNTVCKGSVTNFNNTSSFSSGTIAFTWDLGNFSNSSVVNPSLTYTNSGVYSVQLIASASNGCSDTLTQNTTVNTVPQVNLGGNITTCGASYLLDAQNSGSTYLWNTASTTQTLLVNTNGNYKATVTLANGCAASDSVDITLNVPTKPQLGADTITCGAITLDAGYPNSTYLWSTGANTQALLISASGTYSVTVTDQNNCVGSDTIVVTVSSKPVVNLGADTTLCQGENLLLSAQPGFNYLWSNSSTSQSINPVNSGLYWVDVINPSSLCTGRDSILVVFKQKPSKPLGSDTVSCNAVVLNANNFGANYLWNTGSTTQTINASSTGDYSVIISGLNGCSEKDTINVTVNVVSVNLGPNQIGCSYSILPLDAGTGSSYLWSTGSTSQSIQPAGSGLYSVVVTDAFGCTGTGTAVITVNPSPIKPFGNDTTVCAGLLLNALNAGSTYQWSGLSIATTQTINANVSGQYVVDITGANSCVTKDTINLSVNTVANVNLGNDTTPCQYTPFALNAGPAASYVWSTGATTQTIQLSLSANYWVTTTDALGCTDTDSINVVFKSSPIVNLGVDTSACGFYVLNAQNTGLSYLWNNGSLTQTTNVTNSGSYYVDVTGLNGCVSSDTVQITINQNPVVSFPSNSTGCSGDAVILDAGNPGSTYSWNTGANTQSISVLTTGFYQVSVTDANNCSSTSNGIVTFNNKPSFNLGPDGTFCGNVLLNAGNPGCTYLWNDNSTTQTITASNSGTYSVKVTNQNLCFINDTINIFVNPLPVVNLGNDTSICQGNILQLNAANPGSTYNWNTGANTQTVTANLSGNYIVQVTNSQNCSKKDTIVVTIVNKPVVALGTDRTLCKGNSVVLNAGNPGAIYNWGSNTTGFSANTQIVNIQDTGIYWVNVSNAIGCSSADTIQIRLDDNYVVAKFLSASTAFTGDTLVFINLSYPNPQSYLWNFGDGIVTNQESPTHIFYFSNVFPVKLAATKLNCSDTLTKVINIQQRLSAPKDSIIRFIEPQIMNAIAFPNPTNGNFTLKVTLNVSSELSIRIFDMQGRMLAYRAVNANAYQDDFDLNKLTAGNGIYFVDLITGRDRKTIKIIKTE
ncbi:MAG: PKD domain-containing protein, partial [Bacteroidota bacterium]